MTRQQPRITVLLPVYNGESYIAEAIGSILNQTFPDFKLVIYDDGSTDRTLQEIERFDDARIELRALPVNRGRSPNLSEGVQRAQSEFIARMDADDVAHPERFQKQVAFLDENPEVDILGSNVVFFSEQGEALGIQPEHHEDIAIALLFGFTMLHPTVMMRTSSLRNRGFNYDPRLVISEDFDLWVRMARSGRLHNLQLPLLRMREHPSKVTRTDRRNAEAEGDRVRQKQLEELGVRLGEGEAEVFFRAARSEPAENSLELSQLDRVLNHIISANRAAEIFHQSKLESAAASLFRATCRRSLMMGRSSGAAYWRSNLRRYERLSSRELAGMMWRTAQAMLGLRHNRPPAS